MYSVQVMVNTTLLIPTHILIFLVLRYIVGDDSDPKILHNINRINR